MDEGAWGIVAELRHERDGEAETADGCKRCGAVAADVDAQGAECANFGIGGRERGDSG